MQNQNRSFVLASLLFLYFVWGSTYFAIELGLRELPPFLFASFRFLLATLFMFVVVCYRKEKLPTKKEAMNSVLMGIFYIALGNGLISYGLSLKVSTGIAAVLIGALPIFSLIVGSFYKIKTSFISWVLAGVGLCGIILINYERIAAGNLLGSLFVLGSTLTAAVATILAKKAAFPKGGMNVLIQLFVSGIVLFIFSTLTGEPFVTSFQSQTVYAIFYLAFFGALLGISAYTYLIQNVSPLLATSYAYVNPLVALAIATFIGNEKFTPLEWGGVVAVIASVSLISIIQKRS